MSKGVIYILTNPSFPQYVKIGYADDVDKRLKQLDHLKNFLKIINLLLKKNLNKKKKNLKKTENF